MLPLKFVAPVAVTALFGISSVQAAVTVEPITWNVIGLDSNKPDTVQPNPQVFPPDRYPVGVEVCNTSTTDTESSLKTVFVWDENPATSYIELWDSTGTGDTEAFTELAVPELAPTQCADVYYFVKIDRVDAAYDFTRDYHIEVWDDPTTPGDTATNGTDLMVATPQPRELYVEYLVSQNRNAVLGYTVNGTPVPPGGSVSVKPGDIIELVIDAKTATQGYEQLEVFMALPPDLFTINSVRTTYSANSGTDPDAGGQLYADGCGWENDPTSGNYHNNLSCSGTGKYGGTIQQTVIMTVSNAFSSDVVGQTLIYDFSGSSYHYNSDYEGGDLTFTVDATPSNYDVAVTKTAVENGGSNNGTYTVTLTAIELPNGTDPITEEIVVGDYLPDAYNVKSAPSVGANVTPSAGTVRFCTSPGIGCVAAGAATVNERYIEWTVAASTLTAGNLSETLDIVFDGVTGFSSANPDDYTNCASVDQASGDSVATNNEACVFFAFSNPQTVDLSVQKSVLSVDLGVDPARVTFELVVTNETGGALSAPVFLRDVLPAGYDYVTGQTPSPSGNITVVAAPTSNGVEEILVLEFQDVADNEVQGASASVTFVAEVALPAVGATAEQLQADYTNTVALLDEYTPDIVPLNDEDATNNEATAAFVPPLLNVVKGADGTLLGLTYDYTLTVTPLGAFSTGNVITVSEAPPPGAIVTAMSGIGWTCSLADDDGPAVCQRAYDAMVNASGTSFPDVAVEVTFATSPPSGDLINTAFVEARESAAGDVIANTYDDDIATVTKVVAADLELTKSGSATAVLIGDEVTFTLTLTNLGPDTATGVTVEDRLPADLSYVASSILGGDTQNDGGSPVLTWGVTSLVSGASVDLTFKATVDSAGTFTNVAEVTAANETDPDSTPSNDNPAEDDQDSFDVSGSATAPPEADLAVTKDDGNTTVATGDSVIYRVEVTNNGPDAVSSATLVDAAVAGLTKTAVACAAITPGNCVTAPSIANLESGFALPALANGATYALDVTVTVDATSGSVTNSATVSAPPGTNDPDPSNDMDDDQNLIQNIYDPPFGVKVGTLENGDTQIRWTMVWQNGTGVAVPDVTITDDTSAYPGWSYLGPVTCTGNGVTTVNSCTIIGDIITVNADFGADENLDTLEISFLASVDDPLQGSYQNQASATCTDCGGQTNLSDDNSPTESDPTILLFAPAPTPVPALPWLGLMLLSLLLGGYGWHRAQGAARL